MQELAYQKLMRDNQITLEELPTDARIGIKSVDKIAHAIKMTEQRGQKTTSETLDKLKANDKWVVREILDYMEEKDSNQGAIPNNANDVVKEINSTMSPEEKTKFDEGVRLEGEMAELTKSGKTNFTAEELNKMAPKCFKKIFETYEEGQPNGIGTTKFSLIEDKTNLKTFNLKNK